MEDGADGTVLYGDKKVPRSNFVSWAEARRCRHQASSNLLLTATTCIAVSRRIRKATSTPAVRDLARRPHDPNLRG